MAKKKAPATTLSKGYVLLKCGWEYNDEYYFRPDSGGGNPVKIFTSKADAEAEWERLNLEEFKDAVRDGIRNYGYDSSYVFKPGNEAAFQKLMNTTIDEWFDDDCPVNITNDKDYITLMKMFNLDFYELVEVEFAGPVKAPEVDKDEIEHLKKVLEL